MRSNSSKTRDINTAADMHNKAKKTRTNLSMITKVEN